MALRSMLDRVVQVGKALEAAPPVEKLLGIGRVVAMAQQVMTQEEAQPPKVGGTTAAALAYVRGARGAESAAAVAANAQSGLVMTMQPAVQSERVAWVESASPAAPAAPAVAAAAAPAPSKSSNTVLLVAAAGAAVLTVLAFKG